MAAPLLTSGATLVCTFGVAPAVLTVLPTAQVFVEGRPAATVNDAAGLVNVGSCGMCTSLANPAVASATAAAQGVLTPQPCTPQTTAWAPGVPLVQAGGTPAANATCTLTCAFGGVLTVTVPGATQTLG